MKVLIAAASFSSELSGVQRHALNLVRCLHTSPRITSIVLVLAPWQRDLVETSELATDSRFTLHIAAMGPGSLGRNRWYFNQLPQLATQLGADIVHLTYPVPVRSGSYRCPTVVTLHDLYPYEVPSNFGLIKGFFNRLILQQCLRSVDAIACVSDTTQLLLNRYVPAAVQRRALRIYNCVEPDLFRIPVPLASGRPAGPFLLCVAQHRRNKNILFLLHVFERLILSRRVDAGLQLLLVGIAGPETDRIRRMIKRKALCSRVRLVHGISEAELRWCYQNCAAVVAPSRIEGFGLPVVEALLVGAKVVCSDISAFRELGGSRCRYVPFGDGGEEAFADAIVDTIDEPRRAPVTLPMLSGPAIGKQYSRLYARLLASEVSRFGEHLAAVPITGNKKEVQ